LQKVVLLNMVGIRYLWILISIPLTVRNIPIEIVSLMLLFTLTSHLLCPSNTLVKHSTGNPEIGGSNPANPARERKWRKIFALTTWVRVNQCIRFLLNVNDFPLVSASKLGEGEGS
jgi:hypothetical protein